MGTARRKEIRVVTATPKPRSAAETLTDKFTALIEEQAARMTDEEFKAAEMNFNRVVDRVRALDPRGAVNIDELD